MLESTQHKLTRVRPPRVQITYDVEIGDAIIKKQLPFVVGILADLSGNPETPLPPYKQRKFVYIDPDNFNSVMSSYTPRVTATVPNKLEEGDLSVDLRFNNIDDFLPVSIVKQVAPLNALFKARQLLVDMLGKLDGNDALDHILQEVVADEAKLKELNKLASEGLETTEAAPAEPAEAPAEEKKSDAGGAKKKPQKKA
ncbi:MAG: type VI secretion system contractile sheath small subunit [Desulfovibrionales bacterium]|nr:type VI secretion system contractile sheath small subunit [Desulfovibrionales bacterium]